MLSLLDQICDELSSFLSVQTLSQHQQNDKRMSTNNNNNQNKMDAISKCIVLCLTEKQKCDLRLCLVSPLLDQFWLGRLELVSQLQTHQFAHFRVSSVEVNTRSKAIEVTLDHTHLLPRLLHQLSPTTTTMIQMDRRPVLVLPVLPSKINFFTSHRVNLVSNVIEKLLHSQFLPPRNDIFLNETNLNLNEIKINSKTNQSFLFNDSVFKKIVTLDTLYKSLPEKKMLIILITVKGECGKQLREIIEMFAPNLVDLVKYIEVGEVSLGKCNPNHAALKQISSFEDYANHLERNELLVNEEVKQENFGSIAQTMLVLSLLSSSLRSSISSWQYYGKEAVFEQYQIARIKSILARSQRELPNLPAPNTALLDSEFEWNLIWAHVVKLHQLQRDLLSQLECRSTSEFAIDKMVDHLGNLCRAFSRYYRNVKVLMEPEPHLLGLISSRVRFCEIILEHITFHFHLFNLDTIEHI